MCSFKKMLNGCSLSAMVIFAATSAAAMAQSVPVELNDRNRGLDAPSVPSGPAAIELEVEGKTAKTSGAVEASNCSSANCFEVREIVFSGNQALTDTNLSKLVPLLPSRFDLNGLNEIAARVMANYSSHGFIGTRAVVAPQEITDGKVLINIQEAELNEVKLANELAMANDRKLQKALRSVRSILCDANGCGGDGVRSSRIEGALLTASDVSGQKISGRLRAGNAPGSTELIISPAKKTSPFLTFGFDNFGAESVGKWRFSAGLAVNNVLGDGDAFAVRLMTSDKTDFTNVAGDYSIPIGLDGIRLNFSGWYSDYDLGNQFAVLKARGEAIGGGFGASVPLHRSSKSSLLATVEGEAVRLNDKILGSSNSRNQNSIRVGVSGSVQDTYLGSSAISNFSLTYIVSDLSFEIPANDLLKTSGTSGRFFGQFTRLQSVSGPVTLSAGFFGQKSTGNLDPFSKLSISGPNAVRAYPVGEVTGDDAAVVQAGLGISHDYGKDRILGVRVFYDHGWAKISSDPLVVAGNKRDLAGAGVEVAFSRAERFNFTFFAARTAGTGRSVIDGSKGRIGLSGSLAF